MPNVTLNYHAPHLPPHPHRRDVSDQITNEDQLLGAQQKDAQPQEQQPQDEQGPEEDQNKVGGV